MNYTNIQIETDLNGRAYSVLEKYGLTPAQAVKLFFNQIAETGKVPLSFDWADRDRASAYDQRAMQSFKDWQETGLHITLDEFTDWVDSLETDTPKEMPECHK